MRKRIDLRVAPPQSDALPHPGGATRRRANNFTPFYIVPDVLVESREWDVHVRLTTWGVVRPHRPRYILETHS
jgi:hypothetical protein